MSSPEQVRRDLVRAEAWERLDWIGRIVWRLNHPDDEFGYYFHAVSDIACRYGHQVLGTTRKRLSTQDVLYAELKRLKKTRGARPGDDMVLATVRPPDIGQWSHV
jgi:hypothetical protein